MNTYLTVLSIMIFLTEFLNSKYIHYETIYMVLYSFIAVTLLYVIIYMYYKHKD